MRLSASACSLELPSASVVHSAIVPSKFVAFSCRHTARQHIAFEDWADCAQGFALHLLQRDRSVRSFAAPAYLNRCAANFVRNFRRNRTRITTHEIAWPQQMDEDGVAVEQEFASATSAPNAGLIRQEAHARLCAAMLSLTPLQSHLVKRCYFQDESFGELAEAVDSTPDAVRMSVQRGLKRLRKALNEQGMTEDEACEYLVEIAARGG